ncbi:hypothetical protein SAMN02983003_1064 [Devosia enhydra]|uniref:Uncharacterized protein n=1 Tax=Devosia enhydra TaxID=665118 RepID=A0A1K2HVA2_9HYPH|nr:hypothetical protein [Devosia enhydra]SFZ82414.1 hypothetical protein SAMN02983003_1064 [Devosia enhydra]
MRKDSHSNVNVVASLVPAVQAATLKGSTIDTKGFYSALLIVNTGAIASAGDYVVTMEHSDTTTDGDFTTVPVADKIGTLPSTLAASTVYRQAYIGSKRYLRAVITKTGGTSIAAGAVFVLGMPQLAPVA